MIDRTLDRPSAPRSSVSPNKSAHTPLVEAGDLLQLIKPAEKLILKYPAAAIASAFLVGVALACWIKRK
jgi:hypothetical protein